jgi:hypothetical protein
VKLRKLYRPHPDPGPLPTKTPPKRGEKIRFNVEGLPPFKDFRSSIRNPKHRHYDRFTKLRSGAIKAMRGRSWYNGPVALRVVVYSAELDEGKRAYEYLSGVADSLDGSHGMCFTYLPIIYQDDCQMSTCIASQRDSQKPFYEVEVEFL